MALISYKINRTRVTPDVFTRVWLTYYIGAITAETETDASMVTSDVTRYRATDIVGTELLRGATVTTADMNTALAAKAVALGHTQIEEQTN
jgi:hypothetical protein|tara:strand:- start:130 stop:402 length:273 start_codon:yes stop_codon:yes gene_type:complete